MPCDSCGSHYTKHQNFNYEMEENFAFGSLKRFEIVAIVLDAVATEILGAPLYEVVFGWKLIGRWTHEWTYLTDRS